MKKLKNIFCLSVLAISAFCVMGITEVKAGTATEFKVVCDPNSVETGQTSNCFLLAKVDGTVSFVETTIYAGGIANQQSKNLKIVKVDGPPSNGDVAAIILDNGKGIREQNDADSLGLNASHTDSGALNYKCNNTNSYTEDSYKGCQLFYALKNKQIKHEDDISVNNVTALNSHIGYTVIGHYTVTLSDEATKNDCGRLCVVARYAASDGKHEADLEGATSNNCAEIQVKTGDPGTQPPTGSFTSYLVLIGAAFVAVGAIALAKRNSKFFRV